MKRLLFRIGRVVVAGYAGALLLVAGCQNRLIYHPQRGAEAEFTADARERGLLCLPHGFL